MSIVSIFMAINGIPIMEESSQESTPLLHKEQIIKSFLPVYNLDKRYALGKYQTPYRRLKESILRRSIFSYGTLLLGITA
ncbi:MAG: hypothetical protein LBI53_07615 [Candidatus Peribacteria bacterium]|jgi:hypothetical protein|nr:hypothetical protein [Candidatus Peribacteria bacterium]